MTQQNYNRRKFLRMGLTGASFFAAGGLLRHQKLMASEAEQGAFYSLNQIGDLLPPDENGVMLPPGFKSRVVARSGEAPAGLPGYTWHSAPDGGAVFATDDGGWVYVSNSEMRSVSGGVGAIRFNSDAEVVDAYSILKDTTLNCAGGPTPWGTWLSCEEFDLGQVYECDPMGVKPAEIRPMLGTFKHEAVAVDELNQCLYLTEDWPDGGFYRFTPSNPLPDLSRGQLEIASIVETDGASFIEWLAINDPLAEHEKTRKQQPDYAPFAGSEGIAIYDNKTYFTTKHDNRVWCYDNVSQQLTIVYDIATSDTPILKGVDNVVISAAGDVLIAEDGGDMQIVVLTPDARVIPLVQIIGHDNSEITGPAFDPTYQRLYFSSQRGSLGKSAGGITYEISYIGAV
ncbi:MAG: translocation protein TolB [SAR86 cluster bacterium]|uniref:Translocation protein TolB n=1 Tax=SAR86 cluster bacterium TaxID=2030880 RepID=A0A2A5ATM8_9GAMM|nr:MAG: translocation protein TolB [SAR86 cluster bacterium]